MSVKGARAIYKVMSGWRPVEDLAASRCVVEDDGTIFHESGLHDYKIIDYILSRGLL